MQVHVACPVFQVRQNKGHRPFKNTIETPDCYVMGFSPRPQIICVFCSRITINKLQYNSILIFIHLTSNNFPLHWREICSLLLAFLIQSIPYIDIGSLPFLLVI